jgi:hypothetical protein
MSTPSISKMMVVMFTYADVHYRPKLKIQLVGCRCRQSTKGSEDFLSAIRR